MEQSARLAIIESEYIDMVRAMSPAVISQTAGGVQELVQLATSMSVLNTPLQAIFTPEFAKSTLSSPTGPECQLLTMLLLVIVHLGSRNRQPYSCVLNADRHRIKFFKHSPIQHRPPPDLWEPDFHASA